jgi:hypothetical protein
MTTTKPHHDIQSIATDAEHLVEQARRDVTDKSFAKIIAKHELDVFRANIEALKSGAGARTEKLASQVAAGLHSASARAVVSEMCHAVHDAADLAFEKDEAMRRRFGYGMKLDESSTSSVEHYAHTLLASAAADPTAAAKVHLDKHGLHALEDALHALEGAEDAHVVAKSNRHDSSTHTDSLAHVVSAEAAHIRFVAKRVFRNDPAHFEKYRSTLPRHSAGHRSRHATTPPTPA